MKVNIYVKYIIGDGDGAEIRSELGASRRRDSETIHKHGIRDKDSFITVINNLCKIY